MNQSKPSSFKGLFSIPVLIVISMFFVYLLHQFLEEMMYKYQLNNQYEELVMERKSLDKQISVLDSQRSRLSDPSAFNSRIDKNLYYTDSRDRLMINKLHDWHFP